MKQSSDIRVCNCGMYLRMISSWKFPTGHQRPSVDGTCEARTQRKASPPLASELMSLFLLCHCPHLLVPCGGPTTSQGSTCISISKSLSEYKKEKRIVQPQDILHQSISTSFWSPWQSTLRFFSNPHTGTCNETCTPVPLEKWYNFFFRNYKLLQRARRNVIATRENREIHRRERGTRGSCSVRHRRCSKELAALIRRRQNSRSPETSSGVRASGIPGLKNRDPQISAK